MTRVMRPDSNRDGVGGGGSPRSRATPAPTSHAARLLDRNPALLAGLDLSGLEMFLAGCTLHHYSGPTELLAQGEETRHAFLLLEGRIEVTYIDVNGNRVIAHLALPGEVLGEVEILSGKTCAATCTTLPRTTVAAFTAAHALTVLPPSLLLRNLAGIFHARLMRDNRQHSVAMFYTAEDRVRIHILSLTTPDQPEAQISQANLAALAGCSRQTVNQTLAQLRQHGVVDLSRGIIRVLDRQRLETATLGADRPALANMAALGDGEVSAAAF